MSLIASVATALGAHRYDQAVITEAFADLVTPDPRDRALLERTHAATGVDARHLVLPLDAYLAMSGFGAANAHFIDHAVILGERALTDALVAAGLQAGDVDLIMTTTVTGVAAPSIDARLVDRMGLRHDVKRVPVFGLGCVAGASGVARVSDYLEGHPDDVAVLVCVELCSLTVQRDDASMANLVASGLFGDGAGAVVMVGSRRAERMQLAKAPTVVASRSRFFPDTERVMGWDVGESGFRIVLAPTVADLVEAHIGVDMKVFLADHELDLTDVRHWVSHPGGPKVLKALERALGVDDDALAFTWASLRDVGNLSSVSVLHVLQETIRSHPPGTGDPAVMIAMGPGFSAEFVLLRW
ncbi:MAG: 3-oxoacyl-[acyl-carrier-protein] synthase III C-terminal domain-containing protein [Actinomycetes bacterium]